MAYGFSIKNSSNVQIIGEEFRNFSVISTGTISNNGALPATTASQLLLIRPATGSGQLRVNINETVRCSSGNIQYALCDIVGSVSTNTWGLRVFTESGALAYDSGYRNVSLISNSSYTPSAAGIGSSFGVYLPGVAWGKQRYVLYGQMRVAGWVGDGAYAPQDFVYSYVTFTSGTITSIGYTNFGEYQGPWIPQGYAQTEVWIAGQINTTYFDV